MRKRVLNLLIIIVIATIGFSCTDSKKEQSEQEEAIEKVDSAMIRSAALYQTYCSSCHGEQMLAFADRTWKHGNEKDSLVKSINLGYATAGMPSWKAALTTQQIDELSDYILKGIEQVEKYGFEAIKLETDTFKTEALTFHLDTVVSGMNNPWGMTFLPSGDMLVTEKSGALFRVNALGEKIVVEGTPKVRNDVQGGLLDIILDPDFAQNKFVYISYSDYIVNNEGDTLSGTAINRYTYQNDKLTESLNLFKGEPYTTAMWHYGSRMAFDKQGFLYFSASDRANQNENPQTLSNPKGKVHRINPDGSIPTDNPFVDQKDAVASIYSYGHRNIQGLTLQRNTGEIWTHEHGPRGGDEINIISAGLNYGWPIISYGINYDGTTFTSDLEKEGMEQPLHYWVPSIAPCGMTFVDSDIYPGWKGDLMVGSLRFNYLNRCIMKGDKVVGEEPLMKNIGRVRNVVQGPDGYLYVAVEKPGFVFKIMPIAQEIIQ